ncbi:MAG: NAD-dependent deacylase [Desulfobacterota bacterium]|jgi:NAD-dependent deacetylase|nr:NAD-dependent deacylase [Thermodesulfobacteriota bacterium]
MHDLIRDAAEAIFRSKRTLALTGAGISVESGIPDFRSAGGLWSKYDPSDYATITAFRQDPERVWNMLRDMDALVSGARPNAAHTGLGEMEKMGFLHCIITQNVDNLHQAGGARNVIEYHGNSSTLSCLSCGRTYRAEAKRGERTPRCECKSILKPDVVFFGEAIPPAALNRSFQLASSAEVLMVVGTSAVVSPANTIPALAKERGAKIIEINTESTHLTHTVTDIFISQSAGVAIPELVNELKKRKLAAG